MTTLIGKFLERISPLQGLIALIVLLAGLIYGATAWIQKTARDAVLDEKFLATLAARVRPACIFDSRGAVEADLGAGEYIEDIQVKPAPAVYGYEVIIKAKRHLAYAPLITGIDTDMLPQTATRGKMYDWDTSRPPPTFSCPPTSPLRRRCASTAGPAA
jgi:hypothetical protein